MNAPWETHQQSTTQQSDIHQSAGTEDSQHTNLTNQKPEVKEADKNTETTQINPPPLDPGNDLLVESAKLSSVDQRKNDL